MSVAEVYVSVILNALWFAAGWSVATQRINRRYGNDNDTDNDTDD